MTDDRERLPDVWFSQDYPVLLAIARAELDAKAQTMAPQPEQLADVLGRQLIDVCASAGRLWRGSYIQGGPSAMRGIKDYLTITGVTPLGLREVGAWPQPADLADRLQRFLEAEALATEPTDPEKAGKIRQAARALVDVGVTLAAKFAAEMAKPG